MSALDLTSCERRDQSIYKKWYNFARCVDDNSCVDNDGSGRSWKGRRLGRTDGFFISSERATLAFRNS